MNRINFKKLISFILIMGLLAVSVSALPPMPLTKALCYTYSGKPIQGFEIKLTVGSESIKKLTNEKGCVEVDVGEASSSFQNVNIFYDSLTIDCGFEICNRVYKISEQEFPSIEKFTLSEMPATTCPVCIGGGSSNCDGGSTSYITKCTLDEAREKFPCEEKVCTTEECKETVCAGHIAGICDGLIKPEDCETCDEIICSPEGDDKGVLIIAILISAIAGSVGGIYFTKNKLLGINGGVKVYRNRKGEEVIQHKHSGIRGYHNAYTEHRDKKERHPRGQLRPQYEKDTYGDWEYKG